MKKELNIGLSEEILKVHFDGNVAIAEFGTDLFHVISDLELNGKIIAAFSKVNEMRDIDAIVVCNNENSWNEDFYRNFLQEISGMDFDHENVKIEKFAQHLTRSREIIFLQRIIMTLLNSTKITIAAVKGDVVTPAFGAMLAFDFRYMADNAAFSLAHTKFGLHPSGGLPIFLQKYLGLGKAVELLMKGGKINAAKAKELGLATEVVKDSELVETSVKFAKEIAEGIKYSIRTTKVLSFNFIDELKHYFEIESKLII
jgi:enoyl-CoA hydratase/carnithine racemase